MVLKTYTKAHLSFILIIQKYTHFNILDSDLWEEPGLADPALRHCPGQSFQSAALLHHLRACLSDEGDVLIGPYLQSWTNWFMESLGTMVGFFSNKVKDKVALIRQLSVKHAEDSGKRSAPYRSVRSMVAWELDRGVVGFSFRTESGCRTILRLHRAHCSGSGLVLQGLSNKNQHRDYRSPREIAREAYAVALAPHHSWFLQSAAELVFVALPDRKYFLRLVCVRSQSEAGPALRVVIRGLGLVHQRTQEILERNGLLLLP
uniref:Si:ch73-269m23.5 n=1 Tax=Neogobius melanostomus TaxID=47308 RepID=A0A8C6WX25_9GOBI